jgi:hypothetical protein
MLVAVVRVRKNAFFADDAVKRDPNYLSPDFQRRVRATPRD